MSINQIDTNCQEIRTILHEELASFFSRLPLNGTPDLAPLRLSLTSAQIPLFLASLPELNSPLLFLNQHSVTRNAGILREIEGWQGLLGVTHSWHLIAGPLSEQERQGLITTALSLALHRLLAPQLTDRFLLPCSHDEDIPSPEAYVANTLELHVGERHAISGISKKLVGMGFVRHSTTLEPGTFRVRGEQIDIWHAARDQYTVRFFGPGIESIVMHHGGRATAKNKLLIPPMNFPDETISLSELSGAHTLVRPSFFEEFHGRTTLIFDALAPDIEFPLTSYDSVPGDLHTKQLFFVAANLDRVQHYAKNSTAATTTVGQSPLAEFPFILEAEQFMLASEAAVFAADEEVQPLTYAEGLQLIAELTHGRPAVHSDHGIGIYEGLHTRTINGTPREYIVLRYAEGDLLSIPVELAYKVTPYVGESTPKLHRLGGTLWAKTSKQAKEDAILFARELLQIAREREKTPGTPFIIDPSYDNMLTTSFPYSLTPGQEQTWEEVKADLQKSTPMDRLVVGDVGFGKTEIAVRAAAHVVQNGQQVALLAPTTLLVQQHFDTLQKRLPELAKHIAVLSRFKSPAAQRKVREQISSGEARIIVGTHGLLSSSTAWKNLGLIIIDEEQRFGVGQKEHFKKLRSAMDILSLSATPIPRTLSMALSGLKELSVISTPPIGRKDIISYVGASSDEKVTHAIGQELARQGQVYVVLPKVRQLHAVAHQIKKLVPSVSLAVAHGQLPSNTLAKIMRRFDAGEINVLVSSTIVENGLDLPNANTIIVMHATHYGLSELYQLRGRVGRRDRQGYAYFLYDQQELTSIQRQRLTALTEATRLGSGWMLAQRDLEIRGAGNVLGAEQSGSVNAVGVQLYMDMIHDAVADDTSGTPARAEVEVQVPFTTLIPAHYVADLQTRTRYYQQLSRARTVPELEKYLTALHKTYGTPPDEMKNFELLLRFQIVAGHAGITRVSYNAVTPPDEPAYMRISIESPKLPELVGTLSAIGNWEVRDSALQHDLDAITPEFIESLGKTLLTLPK